MVHLSRTVVWLGGIALLVWGCAAILVGFQMAGDVAAPCGGFIGLIATTLTIVTVQIAKRDTPAVRVEPGPLSVALGVEPDTIAITRRTHAIPQQRFGVWDTNQCGPQSWTRVYNSSTIGGGPDEHGNSELTEGARVATIIEFGRRIERAHPIAEI